MNTQSSTLSQDLRTLILGPTVKDAQITGSILESEGISCYICSSLLDLCNQIAAGAGIAIVPEEAILSDDTGCLHNLLRSQPAWSDFPLLVLTPAGERSAEARDKTLSVGHMTLIKRPVQVLELLSAVKSGIRDRSRQYAVRQHLQAREELAEKYSEQAKLFQKAKVKAEEASRAKSEFLANMSHEIRTPMNAIVGLTHIMNNMNVSAERQKEFLKTLQVSAESLMELINDLLDIAKIENESVELEKMPFELQKLLDDVTNILSVKAREKKISLILNASSLSQKIFVGDPLRIKQVLMNLVGNAIKFTEYGTVSINVKSVAVSNTRDAILTIDIADTGVGIPADKHDSIFIKFSQADSSVTRKYGGTGLGLSITKQLVELMNGTITLKSEEEKGSVFTVMLKMPYTDSVGLLNANAENVLIPDSKSLQILLVEDYEPNILVAKSMLENLGYSCKVARNGREALQILEEQEFNLVLMDVQMPVMDGYSTTRIIREKQARRELPRMSILGVTAHALTGDREKCLNAGMDDYLSKPFDSTELQKKIWATVNH